MPSKEDYTDRREAYVAWLNANGINARDVMRDADVVIDDGPDGRHIRIEVCDLDPEGRRQLDERYDTVATKTVTVPLVQEPPEWWEPYEKPTRDQLLELVEQIEAVASGGMPALQGRPENPSWDAGWISAMQSVREVLDRKDRC